MARARIVPYQLRPPMPTEYTDLLLQLETDGPAIFAGITAEAIGAWELGYLDHFGSLARALYALVSIYASEHGHELVVWEGERID